MAPGETYLEGSKKVLYFIAGTVPTAPEQVEIDELQAIADLKMTLQVRSALQPALGEGDAIEACDYTAGSVPEAFSEVDLFPSTTIGIALADGGGSPA